MYFRRRSETDEKDDKVIYADQTVLNISLFAITFANCQFEQ